MERLYAKRSPRSLSSVSRAQSPGKLSQLWKPNGRERGTRGSCYLARMTASSAPTELTECIESSQRYRTCIEVCFQRSLSFIRQTSPRARCKAEKARCPSGYLCRAYRRSMAAESRSPIGGSPSERRLWCTREREWRQNRTRREKVERESATVTFEKSLQHSTIW